MSVLAAFLALPHDLLRAVLASMARFEPWTYGLEERSEGVSGSGAKCCVLGLSGGSEWVASRLSRDADCSAWRRVCAGTARGLRGVGDGGVGKSRRQYRARVQSEEEARVDEDLSGQCTLETPSSSSSTPSSPSSSAVVLYRPASILHLSAADLAHGLRSQEATSLSSTLLFLALVALAQHHRSTSCLENVRDKHRPRSLSGSTVADPLAQDLALSDVTTVYFERGMTMVYPERGMTTVYSESGACAEDDGEEMKRPRLSECERVSSGRVATLLQRFEELHV